MTQLNFAQLQALWVSSGGTVGWAPFMASVALAESGGTSTAAWNTTENRTASRPTAGERGATGLWQIEWPLHQQLQEQITKTSTRAALYTPNVNAKMAVALFDGGRGWTNWTGDASVNAWRAAGSPERPSAKEITSYHGETQATAGGVTGTAVFTIASAIQNEGTVIVNRLLAGLHLPGHLTTTVTGTGGGRGGTAGATTGRTGLASLLAAPGATKGTGLTFLDVLLSPGSAGELVVRTMEVIAGTGLALLALVAIVLALVGSSLRPRDLVAGLVPGGAVLAGVFGKGASK